MTESEPSAPLPDVHAGCKPALYDNALDAAIERAERAEAEVAETREQLSRVWEAVLFRTDDTARRVRAALDPVRAAEDEAGA